MSKHRKVYKFRMEPTVLQADELLRMAGTVRFLWNWALDRSKTFYRENKKSIPQGQLSSELTELKSRQAWLYDFDSQSLQQVLRDLKRAYENHFHPRMRSGLPRFKTKKNPKQSFRIPQRVMVREAKVYVPKLGWTKIRQSQPIASMVRDANCARSKA